MNTTVTGNAGAIVLDATTAGNINLITSGTGPSVTFNTDGDTSDADITITGNVNNATSTILTLDAGTSNVSMIGTAGAGTGLALQSLTVTGNNVSLGEVTSITDIDVTGDTHATLTGIIDLSGNLTTTGTGTSSAIAMKGADVELQGDIVLTTTNNAVTITDNVDSDSASPYSSLRVNVGNNNITIGGNAGNNNALQKLELITSGAAGTQIDVKDITTTDNTAAINPATITTTIDSGVLLTAETIQLDGDITSNTTNGTGTRQAGVVDINGAVELLGNVVINTIYPHINIYTDILSSLFSFSVILFLF